MRFGGVASIAADTAQANPSPNLFFVRKDTFNDGSRENVPETDRAPQHWVCCQILSV
jgi:hypothetical protein